MLSPLYAPPHAVRTFLNNVCLYVCPVSAQVRAVLKYNIRDAAVLASLRAAHDAGAVELSVASSRSSSRMSFVQVCRVSWAAVVHRT